MTRSRQIAQLSIFSLAAWLGLSGCTWRKSSSNSQDDSSAKGIREFFTRQPKQTLKLTSGQEIDLKTFKISPQENEKYITILERHISFATFKARDLKDDVLLSAELFALGEYTNADYYMFRIYMDGSLLRRPDGSPTGVTKDQIELVETTLLATVSAINKLPKSNLPVYFGACLNSAYIDDLWKNKELYTNLNFTSTSTDPDTALSFSKCYGPSGMGSPLDDAGYLFVVENSTLGVRLGKYSNRESESEVLYLPKSSFILKSITKNPENRLRSNTGILYEVKLEEVGGVKK